MISCKVFLHEHWEEKEEIDLLDRWLGTVQSATDTPVQLWVPQTNHMLGIILQEVLPIFWQCGNVVDQGP